VKASSMPLETSSAAARFRVGGREIRRPGQCVTAALVALAHCWAVLSFVFTSDAQQDGGYSNEREERKKGRHHVRGREKKKNHETPSVLTRLKTVR